jgi:hypothetical protein
VAAFGPFYKFEENYRCPVRFEGWGKPAPDIFGYDSLQPLLLAVTLLNLMLKSFIERGGRVLYPDTNDEFALEDFATKNAGPP